MQNIIKRSINVFIFMIFPDAKSLKLLSIKKYMSFDSCKGQFNH